MKKTFIISLIFLFGGFYFNQPGYSSDVLDGFWSPALSVQYITPVNYYSRYFGKTLPNSLGASLTYFFSGELFTFLPVKFFVDIPFNFSWFSTKNSNNPINLYFLSVGFSPNLSISLCNWFNPYIGVIGGPFYSSIKAKIKEGNDEQYSIQEFYGFKTGNIINLSPAFSIRIEGGYSCYNLNPKFKSYNIAAYISYNCNTFGQTISKDKASLYVNSSKFDEELFLIQYKRYANPKYKIGGIGYIELAVKEGHQEIEFKKIVIEIDGYLKNNITYTYDENNSYQKIEISKIIKNKIKIPLYVELDRDKILDQIKGDAEFDNSSEEKTIKIRVVYDENGKRYNTRCEKKIKVYNYRVVKREKIVEQMGSYIFGRDKIIHNLINSIKFDDKFVKEHDIPKKFYKAIVFFNLIKSLGLGYNQDPGYPLNTEDIRLVSEIISKGFKEKFNKGEFKIDCDDYVVLFASFLQNVNINFAIVLLPDHVFLLFDTGVKFQSQYRISMDNTLFVQEKIGGKARIWIPMETVYMAKNKSKTFSEAWKKGIKQMKNYSKGFKQEGNKKYKKKFIVDIQKEYPPAEITNCEDVKLTKEDKQKIQGEVKEALDVFVNKRFAACEKYKPNGKKLSSKKENFKLGLCYLQKNDTENAAKKFVEVLKLKSVKRSDPLREAANELLGVIYKRKGNYKLAKKDYQKLETGKIKKNIQSEQESSISSDKNLYSIPHRFWEMIE